MIEIHAIECQLSIFPVIMDVKAHKNFGIICTFALATIDILVF